MNLEQILKGKPSEFQRRVSFLEREIKQLHADGYMTQAEKEDAINSLYHMSAAEIAAMYKLWRR